MNNHFPPPTTLPAGSKVWAYVRYAAAHTPESAETNQRDEIEKYCQEYGLELTSIFVDDGKSGSNAKSRPAFQELIEKSSQPDMRPNGLLVWSYSCFARNMKDFITYQLLLDENDVIVRAISEPSHFADVLKTPSFRCGNATHLKTIKDINALL